MQDVLQCGHAADVRMQGGQGTAHPSGQGLRGRWSGQPLLGRRHECSVIATCTPYSCRTMVHGKERSVDSTVPYSDHVTQTSQSSLCLSLSVSHGLSTSQLVTSHTVIDRVSQVVVERKHKHLFALPTSPQPKQQKYPLSFRYRGLHTRHQLWHECATASL